VEAARDAFARATDADTEDETGAAERLDELDGITIDDLGDDDEDDDDDEEPEADSDE
jgi:hypothetical protein